MGDDDVAEMLAALAVMLEQVAEQLEKLMPALRKAREALADWTPVVAEKIGLIGSVEQFDAAVAEGHGYARVEAARRRILAAIREPLDDLEP